MARGLKRSLVKSVERKKIDGDHVKDVDAETVDDVPPAFKRAAHGKGSAWKAGAAAQVQAGLDDARHEHVESILNGNKIIEIDPEQITDLVGTDRRHDWMEQDDFKEFVSSIQTHGQDMPILVWPRDPNWMPDEIEPTNLERVQFLLLAGRRRTEAAKRLGLNVRAVIASQAGRGGSDDVFEMLSLRFRENEEREDLGAFERLLSIAEMYEALSKTSEKKIKAVEFAERIGVHESIVSRARSVYASKDEILNAFKNVYEFSFSELQKALAELSEKKPRVKKTKQTMLKVTRKIGSHNLALETSNGKLSVKTSGVMLSKQKLEELGDLIGKFLGEESS